MGNFDHKRMDTLLNKYIIKNNKCTDLNLKYNYFLKPRKDINKVNEKSHFKDSSLSLVYKIKDMKEKDKITLSMIHGLLTSLSSRLLNKKLRDEEELVYSAFASPYIHYGCLEITAFINKKNKKLVYKKILEVIEDLKNSKMIDPLLDNLKDRKRIALIKGLDDKYYIFNEVMLDVLKIEKKQDVVYKKMLKITSKDICELVDRLVLDTIYFIEEENK